MASISIDFINDSYFVKYVFSMSKYDRVHF